MLSNRSIGFRSLSALVTLVQVTLSFWLWLYIWEDVRTFDHAALGKYFIYNEFLLVGILFGFGGSHSSQGPHYQFVDAVRRSARQTILGLFGILAVVVALQDTFISRSFLFSYLPWLFLVLVFANYIAPKWLSQWAFSGNREERVMLAGTVRQARQIEYWLERKLLVGFRAVGIVCPPEAAEAAIGPAGAGQGVPFPVLGNLDELDRIMDSESITQVIVLDLSLGPERLRRLTQLCERRNVRLLALDSLDNYFNHTTTIFEDDGLRVIGLREEPLESPVNRMVKRALDLAIAVPVVVLVLPWVTALVWLLQRWQSRGPVIFRQERIGMMGQKFMMYKYRTMHVDHGNEARQASRHDERIYPAGQWLRKLSVDELPQFINVLKGDMSVVGPRPHLQQHEELWISAMGRYVIRRFIRPGITGYAQVKGYRGEVRGVDDVERRVEMDIHYLENWSFSLDMAIVLKTIKQCLIPPRSAY